MRPPTRAVTAASIRSSQDTFPEADVSSENSLHSVFAVATFAIRRCAGLIETAPMDAAALSVRLEAMLDFGTSAIPQIGQAPGRSETMNGCIGQVYCSPSFFAPPSPAASSPPCGWTSSWSAGML